MATMSRLCRVSARTTSRRLLSNAAATCKVQEIPSPGGKWPFLGHLPRMLVRCHDEVDSVLTM